MEDKNILLLDFDGVICDNNDLSVGLIKECINEVYGKYNLPQETIQLLAEDLYYFNTGDNGAILKNRIPQTTEEEIELAQQSFKNKALAGVYQTSQMVGGAKELIQMAKDKGIKIFISSLAHKEFIASFLERMELLGYFENIYGKEDGKKDLHISQIRQNYPEAKIYFVSDGTSDAKQAVDNFYAYVSDNNQRRREAFAQLGYSAHNSISSISEEIQSKIK